VLIRCTSYPSAFTFVGQGVCESPTKKYTNDGEGVRTALQNSGDNSEGVRPSRPSLARSAAALQYY
jgi:hypothetical protein